MTTYDDAPGSRVRLRARGATFTLVELAELVRLAQAIDMPPDAPVYDVARGWTTRRTWRQLARLEIRRP